MRQISRPDGMCDIESILEKNTNVKYSDRWHPVSVSFFESELKNGSFCGMSKELKKNIAYSLQYLEYIQKQLEEIHLHGIIETHLWKSYIITAMGIIEGVFHHLVKLKGFQKKSEWEHGKPTHTNVFRENGAERKYIVSLETKLSTPQDLQMDFEYLINKVQEKKLIQLTYRAFPHIKALKRIRNKVHLHLILYKDDTDYMSISFDDYLLMRYILFLILRDETFSPPKETALAFIMPNAEEMHKLKEYLEKEKEEIANGQA